MDFSTVHSEAAVFLTRDQHHQAQLLRKSSRDSCQTPPVDDMCIWLPAPVLLGQQQRCGQYFTTPDYVEALPSRQAYCMLCKRAKKLKACQCNLAGSMHLGCHIYSNDNSCPTGGTVRWHEGSSFTACSPSWVKLGC